MIRAWKETRQPKHHLLFIAVGACLLFASTRNDDFALGCELPPNPVAIADPDQYKLRGHDFPGVLVEILDSDKVLISQYKTNNSLSIRLYGVEAPEKGQPYWQEAKDFLCNLLAGKWVKVTIASYHVSDEQPLAILDLPTGTLANEELVKAGLAWVHEETEINPTWAQSLKAMELEARESKRGLWADPIPIPPWQYRKVKSE